MRRLVDRFIARAGKSRSFEDLGCLIAEAASELGFTYFALLHHRAADLDRGSSLRLDNYPIHWIEHRRQLLLRFEDPVHQLSRRTNVAFAWRDLASFLPLTGGQREMLRASRRFGLGDGLTVPVNIPGEPAGSFSFAMKPGVKLTPYEMRSAEIVGAYAFDAARRIFRPTGYATRPHLSRREIDCMRLAAMGKSDWEIAHILGIGFETAHQYLKRARAAYGVATRTQLVVAGLRDDWISIDEVALPPTPNPVPRMGG